MGPLVPIAALAMAPDASWAVTVTQDGTIRTLGTGTEPRILHQAVPIDGSQPVAVALADSRLIRVVWAAKDGLGLYESGDEDEPNLSRAAGLTAAYELSKHGIAALELTPSSQ